MKILFKLLIVGGFFTLPNLSLTTQRSEMPKGLAEAQTLAQQGKIKKLTKVIEQDPTMLSYTDANKPTTPFYRKQTWTKSNGRLINLQKG